MCGHLGVVSNFVSPQGILNQLTNSYAGLARMFSEDPIISVLLKSDCPMSGYQTWNSHPSRIPKIPTCSRGRPLAHHQAVTL